MALTRPLRAIAQSLEEKTGVVTSSNNLEILKQKIIQFMLVHTEYRTDADLLGLITGDDFFHSRMREELIEYLLNHETSFFRDRMPFQAVKNYILPALLKRKKKNIRIWSSACSTGQEAYSLALLFAKEEDLLKKINIEIYASDISSVALEKAKNATYNKLEVQRGLPISDLIYYFEQINMNAWKLKDEITSQVTFFQHNLFDPLPQIIEHKFDLVLCRNVLIYFSTESRLKILGLLALHMQKDGYLILGASEGMLQYKERFATVLESQDYLIYELKP